MYMMSEFVSIHHWQEGRCSLIGPEGLPDNVIDLWRHSCYLSLSPLCSQFNKTTNDGFLVFQQICKLFYANQNGSKNQADTKPSAKAPLA